MLRIFRYRLPFKTPFKIANHLFDSRCGLFLTFETEGITAYSEIAPLPGFSKETLAQVETVLIHNKHHLESLISAGEEEEMLKVLDSIHGFPSLSFGLDTLILDLISKKKNTSIPDYLFNDSSDQVRSNFTIGIQKEEHLVFQKIQAAINNGFDTGKFKVGVDFDLELKLLTNVRTQFPKLKIRVDANQAWSREEAVDNLLELSVLDIEYCEQPVDKDDIEGLKLVKEQVKIPIAADESIQNKKTAFKIIEEKACDILILKPAIFGRISDLIVTKQKADSHSMELVFTTSLDATIGRTMSAMLASGLGSKKYAHGLATGSMFEDTENSNNEVIDGYFILPSQPGIGRSVDLTSLAEVS